MHAARSRAVISPYTLLGVTAASNPEEVRAAYKKRALETHPDKGGDPEEFLRVKQAYEAITSGKAALPGAPPGRPPPPCRPTRFNPDAADPTYGVPLSERLARKRPPPQSMEEELSAGFSSIPRGPAAKRVAERMAAGDAMQARQNESLSARVSAQAGAAKSKAPAEVSVSKLWEKLTKLPAERRTLAISNLDAGLRAQLSKYLETRKTGRVDEPARPSPSPSPSPETTAKMEEVKPGSDSDSGESSSSDSSDSSNENHVGGSGQRAVMKGQKHLHRVVGKTSREAG